MRRDSSGLWHRPTDRVILAEVRAVYQAIPVQRSDVVLDLGAHIGAASRFLLDRGVARVVAVEPDPANLAILRRNLAGQSAVIVAGAVGPWPGETTLFAAGSHLSTTVPGEGRRHRRVRMVALSSLMAEYRPTLIKCDIEFGEYELPELRALPPFVSVLAIEVHVRYDLVYRGIREPDDRVRERRQAAADLLGAIERQGFRPRYRREKRANDQPIEDATGLDPCAKSVDAVFVR